MKCPKCKAYIEYKYGWFLSKSQKTIFTIYRCKECGIFFKKGHRFWRKEKP